MKLCYWAAVMLLCFYKCHNYQHQSKIDCSLVTTKHFTGLTGASFTMCIWSQSSLWHICLSNYTNSKDTVQPLLLILLCSFNHMCSYTWTQVCLFLQPWMLQRMPRGHDSRRDMGSMTQRGWRWNRTALKQWDTLQHQAGFEYCIREQELPPHTPKALWNSCTVLIPHSGKYSTDLQPWLT